MADTINQVVIETKAIATGRIIKNEELNRVRIGEGSYRNPKYGWNLNKVLDWLQANGFQFSDRVASGRIGTITTKSFYVRQGAS